MKHYIVYDPASGEIKSSGSTTEAMFCSESGDPNRVIMEGVASGATHYVLDGVITPYTEEQAASKSAQPSPHHRWSNETFSWVDTLPPGAREYVAAGAVRTQRDQLLAQSDWTDTLSAKTRMGDALYNAWQDYRQILRDVPQQAGFPTNVAWPEPPSPT